MNRKPSHRPAADLGAHLHYSFGPGTQRGAQIANTLFDLLEAVRSAGSIRHAALALGCSYRHAWGALNAGHCVVAGFHVPARRRCSPRL